MAEDKKEYALPNGPKLIVFKGSLTDWPDMQERRLDVIRPMAVVNAANQRFQPGGGVDGLIHGKAGPELAEECRQKPEIRPGIRCPTGEAVHTKGYKFKTEFIIHTCGPVYNAERRDECTADLTNAYKNSLEMAQDLKVQCVAFPAISTGVYAYPFREAAEVSLNVLVHAKDPIKEVWMVLWAKADFDVFTQLADSMELRPYQENADPHSMASENSLSTIFPI